MINSSFFAWNVHLNKKRESSSKSPIISLSSSYQPWWYWTQLVDYSHIFEMFFKKIMLFLYSVSMANGFVNKIQTPFPILWPGRYLLLSLSPVSPTCSLCSSHSAFSSHPPSSLPVQTWLLLSFSMITFPYDLLKTFWS